MSVAVKIWVEKLDYRSIEIPSSRKPHHQRKGESDESFLARRLSQGANRSKRLTFAHRETLKVLADHARHNGLTWPGMSTIAKEVGVKERQAFRIIADLELADLVKIHEGGGRGHSNHYWVRVPWVQEPERVVDLPLLDNKHYPSGARLKCDESGRVTGIDVDYYVRIASLKTLSPVTGFIAAEGETLSPAAPFSPETLSPVTPFSGETLSPVTGEPSSLRESPSSFESPSSARAARAKNGEHEEDEDRAEHVQPTLPRFSVLPTPEDTPPHSEVIRAQSGVVYKALEAPPRGVAGVETLQAQAERVSMERCPDCGNAVTLKGDGHRGGTDACRAYGRGGDVQQCPVCNEWIAEQGRIHNKPLAPSIWHTIWCRLREDHAAPSQWVDIEDQVGDRRAVAGDTAPVQRSRDETALSRTSNARTDSVDGNDAAIRARLAEKLSDDELALLDDLERERVAYAAQGEVLRRKSSVRAVRHERCRLGRC